jgi:hypothetical protein
MRNKRAAPFSKPDMKYLKSDAGLSHVMDAELSPAGVVITTRNFCKQDPAKTEPRAALLRFCQYLEKRGYGVPAEDLLDKLLRMSDGKFVKWVETVVKQYTSDDTVFVDYIINGKEVKKW